MKPKSNNLLLLELKYDKEVIPEKITIFETYNPGTIVKILAAQQFDDKPHR